MIKEGLVEHSPDEVDSDVFKDTKDINLKIDTFEMMCCVVTTQLKKQFNISSNITSAQWIQLYN
jgi:hypothetical protein